MFEGKPTLSGMTDVAAKAHLRAIASRVWRSLSQIAELFGRDKSVISCHIKPILGDGE